MHRLPNVRSLILLNGILDPHTHTYILVYSFPLKHVPSRRSPVLFPNAAFIPLLHLLRFLRDWSLIMGRGATKWENRGSETFCTPLPLKTGLNFLHPLPLLKSGNFLRPPFNMAKTSSYCVKTTPKLFFFLFFVIFFYRSSSALHRRSSTEILSRPLGHLLCRGSPNV